MSRRKLNANIPLSQNDVEELFMDDISDLPISVQQVIREHLNSEWCYIIVSLHLKKILSEQGEFIFL